MLVQNSELLEWDGVKYFERVPFTGVAVEKYDNGQKKSEETYKGGKWDGLWTHWYQTGQKAEKTTYKHGKEHGLETRWYKNGQKKEELTHKDGNPK